jgi:hypothetical protein
VKGGAHGKGAGLGVLAWLLASCLDVPAPEGGILSLSPVRLPSPGLVVGDTMRDSTGVAAPLQVVAYDAAGTPVQGAAISFVVIDTMPAAHLSGPFLIGDTVGTVRVIGSTEALQTQPTSLKVTLSPDTMVAADSIVHRRKYTLGVIDSVDANIATTVQHRVGTVTSGVESVVVRYAIEQSPTGINNAQTMFLVNGNVPSERDTSDATGRASRTARLRLLVKNTFATDTALIRATASYAGRTIGNILFTLIYTCVKDDGITPCN